MNLQDPWLWFALAFLAWISLSIGTFWRSLPYIRNARNAKTDWEKEMWALKIYQTSVYSTFSHLHALAIVTLLAVGCALMRVS